MVNINIADETALDGSMENEGRLPSQNAPYDGDDDAVYEAQRRANILANAALLESLGLKSTHTATLNAVEKPKEVKTMAVKVKELAAYRRLLQPREQVPKRRSALQGIKAWRAMMSPYKRRSLVVQTERPNSDSEEEASGYATSEAADEDAFIPRRMRTRYSIQRQRDEQREENKFSKRRIHRDDDDFIDDRQRQAQRLGERIHNPKTFGHIPGVPVGTIWASRMDCSTDAVHAPTVAGISGNGEAGCWSIALSGGYEDDIDEGERFTFTGSGGRKLQGLLPNGKNLNLRTAPQSFDQSFDHPTNAALVTSCKTRKPIRVIRGFKGESVWNPPEGYVYCGLYTCSRYWRERGQSGFLVCRFEFQRVKGQAPLLRFDVDPEGTPEAKQPLVKASQQSDKATTSRRYSRSRSHSIVEVVIERHPSHSPSKTA